MGVTHIEIANLKELIYSGNIKSVIELGAQQQYTEENYGRYMSEWFEEHGIRYGCIDLNGENEASKADLAQPIINQSFYYPFVDLVTDFGTSEHVSEFGMDYSKAVFSWNAIYNCWKNKFNLVKVGGYIYSVNPKIGNWPDHGVNYYTQEFYWGLAKISDLRVLEIGEVAAMGNEIDGINVTCIMTKIGDSFPSLEEFKTLDLRTE